MKLIALLPVGRHAFPFEIGLHRLKNGVQKTRTKYPAVTCDIFYCSLFAAVVAASFASSCRCAWNSQEINTINTLIANFRLRYIFFGKFRHWAAPLGQRRQRRSATSLPESFTLSPRQQHRRRRILVAPLLHICVLQIHSKSLLLM